MREPGGRIRFTPCPLMFTTNSPSLPPSSKRWKTIRFPSGDQSNGTSSPPGFDVTCWRSPPSEERIVWIPLTPGSSMPNVSQRRREPSGEGIPQGLKTARSRPPTSRNAPVSTSMIREPPNGTPDDPHVAIRVPSENQRGHSAVSDAPETRRSCVPSGSTTYAWVSPSAGLKRANAIWPLAAPGRATATPAATATAIVASRSPSSIFLITASSSAAEAVVGLVAGDHRSCRHDAALREDPSAADHEPGARTEPVGGDHAVGERQKGRGNATSVRDAAAEDARDASERERGRGAGSRHGVADHARPFQRQVRAEHRDPAAERDGPERRLRRDAVAGDHAVAQCHGRTPSATPVPHV